MSTPGNLSEQILALPSGAGAVQSAGQTFQADPQTGTGRFAVPIETMPGHAGLGPALALTYSTHGGNDIAGLGWSLGLARVERRTDKGLPSYVDADDTFTLQGDELLHVGGEQYRYRIEGRFARVRHVRESGRDFWVVTERDGTRTFYGLEADQRLHDGPGRMAAWYVSKKQDANGNEVVYKYFRDTATRDVRLTSVEWAGCYRVTFTYEDRADPVESARTGFLHVRDQRMSRIAVEVKKTSTGAFHTYRRYDLVYSASVWSGRSLLVQVAVTGINADATSRAMPALTFSYANPELTAAKWRNIEGAPNRALSDRNVTLAYQSGSGLPDILEARDTGWFLRQNLGDGTFDVPRLVGAPAQVKLDQPGTFISDMDGDGWGDLVVRGGDRVYRGVPGGGFGQSYASAAAPSVDLDAPGVRVLDLDGDGIPDVLQAGIGGWRWYRNLGRGEWAGLQAIQSPPPLRLDDPRVHLADLTGDGFSDLVYVERTRLLVYRGLGEGRFASPIVLQGPDLGSDFDPRAVRFTDLTGSGQADILYVRAGDIRAAFNVAGRFTALTRLGRIASSSRGHVEPVDLLGSGAGGLLFTDEGAGTWRFLELFPEGNPDLLAAIDNGLGANTTLTYGSSSAHWARDRATARPWETAMPSAQRVVDAVTTIDLVTGNTLGVTYQYHHGVYDGDEREFRGFARVEQIDREAPRGDPQPISQAMTRRWYHTGADVDLRSEYAPVEFGALDDEIPNIAWARRSLRSLVRREETYALDGNPSPYVVAETAYRVFPIRGGSGSAKASFAPLPVRTRTTYTERGPEQRRSETTTTYDLHNGGGYGVPVEVREKGYGRTGSFSTAHEQQQQANLERYTKATYVSRDEPDADFFAAYAPSYLVGKPSLVERWAVTGSGDVLLAKERSFYDGADYQGLGYPGSGTVPGVTRGRLSCKLLLALTDSLLTTTYPVGSGASAAKSARGNYITEGTDHSVHAERSAFNAYGLLTGSKDPNGNLTAIAYDSTHTLFPVGGTDAAGHPTAITRSELPFQVAAVVDANDNRTEFTYDPSGLPATRAVMGKFVSGAWQGDPATHPTEEYTYDFATTPIKVVTKSRQIRLGATFDVARYIDGLGRTIQERHTAEPDPATSATRCRVTGWQIFNHKGLVVKAFQPVFAATTTYAAGDQTTAFVETKYDPLGRPMRVNYPDGSFETTDYHPWLQAFADRNDNAGGIASSDTRYGAHLATFRGHLNTPTRKYVDALGREIAVAEDNGAGLAQTFRVTTYELAAGQFTGTNYNLNLKAALASNYFVMIRGTVNVSNPDAANHGVRVTADPNGTGDLTASGSSTILTLSREASSQGDWIGVITVWECLTDTASSGFQLVDVKTVSFGTASSGAEQTVTATTTPLWGALGQVALYGGPRGGGSRTNAGGGTGDHHGLHAKLTPSGTNTITGSRWGAGGSSLVAVDFTVYVVQWGSEHTVQRVVVSGTAGGDALDATGEFDTATITATRRQNTWCWMSGWAKATGTGDSFNGLVLALGDGTSLGDVETKVAVGGEYTAEKNVLVTVHSHPALSVDWQTKADGDGTATTKDLAPATSGETETYDESSNPRTTEGLRVAHQTHSMGANSARFDIGTLYDRNTAAQTFRMRRAASGDPWVSRTQSIDTVGVTAPNTSSSSFHVTRSVLNLKDEVTEVWDARSLAFATWLFTYDYAGWRVKADHATAIGARYSLADAAGNPVWSRDARAIEVDRTFDSLNRPLQEESDDGAAVKLRRRWTYIAYSSSDTASKNNNLFGRVEEERDADGLRYFEYDWRGLVLQAYHKFWAVTDGSGRDWDNDASDMWNIMIDWDPAVSSTARASIPSSGWLVLDNLTDTTTVTVSTTYDAADRPIEVTYPEGMKLRSTWNPAGLLARIEVDRGAGGGYADALKETAYNARGQVVSFKTGNDVKTTREYDSALERLTRIFTRRDISGTISDFQDLLYAYDPAGNPVNITDDLAVSTYKANQVIPNARTFRYDARYRLIRATGKKHRTVVDRTSNVLVTSPDPKDYEPYSFRYGYDAVGNFSTNQEYKSGTNNLNYKAGRIDLFNGDATEAGSFTDPTLGNFTYDANGNTTKTPRLAALRYTMDNQCRWVDLGGGGQLRYLHHADQRCLRFVNKGGGTRALGLYLGVWEYHQRQGSSAYSKLVLHAEGHGRHAQVERVLAGSDPGSLSVFYQHGDHLGSANALTKSDGTLLSQEEYFPSGRPSDRRDARVRYRFIGVERDDDTALYVTGPRAYDPVSGRFLQPDPAASNVPVEAPYTYASAQPIRRTDVTGYFPQDALKDTVFGRDVLAEARKSDLVKEMEALGPLTRAKDPVWGVEGGWSHTSASKGGLMTIEAGKSLAATALIYAHELYHSVHFRELTDLKGQARFGEITKREYVRSMLQHEAEATEFAARVAADRQYTDAQLGDQATLYRRFQRFAASRDRLNDELASGDITQAQADRRIGRLNARERRWMATGTSGKSVTTEKTDGEVTKTAKDLKEMTARRYYRQQYEAINVSGGK